MSFSRAALTMGVGFTTLVPITAMAQHITGAGSTLAQPVYEKWADVSSATTGVTLNYQGVGSGAGQKLIFQRTVDFGASDAPVPAAKLSENKLLQFPTVIGAVDIAINLPGIRPDELKRPGDRQAEQGGQAAGHGHRAGLPRRWLRHHLRLYRLSRQGQPHVQGQGWCG